MANILRSINLSTRVLLVVLALFVASIWGLAARVAAVLQTDLENVVSAPMSATVGYVAADIDTKLRLRIRLLNEIAASITPDILADPAKLQRLLDQRRVSSALFPNGLGVTNTEGIAIAEFPRSAGRLGGSFRDRDYFQEIMAGAKLAIGRPVTGHFAKRALVGIAVPLHDASGNVAGVLIGPVFPSDPNLFGLLEQTKIGNSGYLLVISLRDGVVVSATDKSQILRPLSAPGVNALLDRRRQGFEGMGHAVNPRGVDVLSVSRNIRTTGWMVISAISTEEAFAPIASIKQQIYLTALLLSLLVMAVLYFVLKRQLAPLQAATTAMRRMTEGTAAFAPLPAGGDDEIGRLVESFNQLVAERGRLEETLQHREQHARALLDAMPIAIGHADTAERITFANHLYRISYCGGSDPIGRTVREAVGEEIYAFVEPYMQRALAGENIQFERVYAGDDGLIVARSLRYVPDRDAAGEVVGYFALIEDSSKRKQAEAAWRESEERLGMVVESLAEGVVVYDAQCRILSANQAAQRILGLSANEIIGQTSIDPRWRTIREDGTDWPGDLHASMQTLRTGEPQTGVIMGVHKPDGTLTWLSINSRILPGLDASRTRGVVTSFTDVTRHKSAEARQRLAASVFDHAAEAIMITDRNNEIISVNRAFSEITGYSEQEVIGKNPRLRNFSMQDPSFYKNMWESIREKGRWSGEIWDRRRNGDAFCQYLSISTVRDENGEIANHCSMFTDITERKNAESALQRLNAELEQRVVERTQALEQANREMQSFSYSISHDLRAPLRAIDGFSKIVLAGSAGKFDQETIDNLGRIAAAAERMGWLIDDLLKLSQVSRTELRRQAVNLSQIAGEVAKNLAQVPPERQVEVLIAPDMMVDADQGLIQIVLENLIGNAWKFTSRTDGAKIEVGQQERDGEMICFVRDNGAGFDMRYAGKLFGAFQRLHTQREFEGTGIGLSIVQRIVVKHGGRTWAEAKSGAGATLYFTLAQGTRAV